MQRGRVARRQLVAVEVTPSQLDCRLQRGRLIRLHGAVHAVGHLAPIPLGAETAALLAAGSTAVLSHVSAAALWGCCPGAPAP